MEIFGIGPAELVLILVIAFIVLGPERLPEVTRQLIKWARQLRSMTNEFTNQLRAEWDDMAPDLQAAPADLRELSDALSRPSQYIEQELTATLKAQPAQAPRSPQPATSDMPASTAQPEGRP